jgi:hypothetical protein
MPRYRDRMSARLHRKLMVSETIQRVLARTYDRSARRKRVSCPADGRRPRGDRARKGVPGPHHGATGRGVPPDTSEGRAIRMGKDQLTKEKPDRIIAVWVAICAGVVIASLAGLSLYDWWFEGGIGR